MHCSRWRRDDEAVQWIPSLFLSQGVLHDGPEGQLADREPDLFAKGRDDLGRCRLLAANLVQELQFQNRRRGGNQIGFLDRRGRRLSQLLNVAQI